MKLTLYGIMFIALGAMIWLAFEYRMKGNPKVKIAAILVSLLALSSAILSIGMDHWLPQMQFKKYRERHLRTQHVAYKVLGQKVAELHNGGTIVIVNYDNSNFETMAEPTDEGSGNKRSPLNSFKDGLGDQVEITKTIEVIADSEFYYEDSDAGSFKRRGTLYSTKTLNAILDKYGDCSAIVLLVGLPYDHEKEFKLWTIKDAAKRPALVLLNASPGALKKAVKRDFVSLMMVDKSIQFDVDKPLPESDQELFDSRYLLITKDNVDTIAETYPKLFN